MRRSITTISLLLVGWVTFIVDVNAQSKGIWTGDDVTFVKADYDDWTKAATQDRIRDSVWITRKDEEGIFNIKVESGYTNSSSPSRTKWAFGNTSNLKSLSFRSWEDAVSSNPPGMVNKDMVLLIVKDSIYIDIKFTKWTSGGLGGGFTYTRSSDCRDFVNVAKSSCDSFVSPSKRHVWKKSGVYFDTLTNAGGCDSILEINLVVHGQDTGSFFRSACGSYVMPISKRVVSTTGTHYDTIPKGTICGRDSIVAVKLFVYKVPTKSYTVSSCDSFVSPSGKHTWTTSGTYSDVLPSSQTCDTAVTVDLTIFRSTSETVKEAACDSFVSVGNRVYKATGFYSDTLQTTNGCDSIINVDLTVNNSAYIKLSPTHCTSYYTSPSGKFVWTTSGLYFDTMATTHGCDSVLEINLSIGTLQTDVQRSECDSMVSPSGKYTYTVTGLYSDTLVTTGGCDSILTINYTQLESSSSNPVVGGAINRYHAPSGKAVWTANGTYLDTISNVQGCDSFMQLDITIETHSLDVTQNGDDLTAAATGVNYQWLDCDNGYARVDGETSQTFTVTKKGRYAVEISNQWNSDTSECTTMNLSIGNVNPHDIKLYPNPNKGSFSIDLGTGTEETQRVDVYGVRGDLIWTEKMITPSLRVELPSDIATGVYTVKITGRGFIYNAPLIVE
ncbi:MAG: T9SS type A sorting domain-containing protein [Bacteroidia bacterium]|nr:T9SS type A sorting domain-containing protein [Bacteroidia bacterium]